MTDRILNSAWWVTLMTMICLTSGIALLSGYRGLFELIETHWMPAIACGGLCIVSIASCLLLCRHRDDLL